MAKRSFDFTESQKWAILAFYNNVCAACGADDALHADHWIAGESADDGVCLCAHCNVAVKGGKYIPEFFRLPPRDALNVVTHAEYKAQVAANRKAFAEWAAQFRFTVKGKHYRTDKFRQYNAPY